MEISRRTFAGASMGSLMTFSFLETIFAGEGFADEIKPVTAQWLKGLHELGSDVKERKLSQIEWQSKTEELMAKVDMNDLLKFIDFEKVTANLKYRDKGERSIRRKLPEVEGLPTKLVFGHQIFALKKGCSVAPHGHNNMCTGFLVMKGSFEGKLYDRLEDTKTHLIIRPSVDRTFKAGEVSTISEHKDNIHWFKATSETAFIFNIHVLDIEQDYRSGGGRTYLDPFGEKMDNGLIKARRIEHREAYQKFG